jgi:hypothetical protein
MKRQRLKPPPWLQPPPWLKPPPWLLLGTMVVILVVGVRGDLEPGEFVAGSFILTQKALDEAPYRYSSFLTEVTTPIFPSNCKSTFLWPERKGKWITFFVFPPTSVYGTWEQLPVPCTDFITINVPIL